MTSLSIYPVLFLSYLPVRLRFSSNAFSHDFMSLLKGKLKSLILDLHKRLFETKFPMMIMTDNDDTDLQTLLFTHAIFNSRK